MTLISWFYNQFLKLMCYLILKIIIHGSYKKPNNKNVEKLVWVTCSTRSHNFQLNFSASRRAIENLKHVLESSWWMLKDKQKFKPKKSP